MPMPQYNGPAYGYNPYQTYLPQSPWQGPQLYMQPQTSQSPVQQVQTQTNQSLLGHIVTANAITQAQFAQQQSAAALQAQLADCCCQNREAIAGVNYNMATSTNAVTTAISNAARDITENQNTNYRQLHDELVAYRMEDKDNTIAELRSQVNALNLSASQSNQNAYLVAQLKTPAPVPAYTVPNPNAYYGCQQNCYQSCGC